MKKNQVARLLAYVTEMVNQQLLLQNEYLLAENRILRAHLPSRLLLTDPERSTLAVLGKRLGRQGLEPVASVAKPDTILAWFRKLVAQKLMAPGTASVRVDRPSHVRSLNSSSVWLVRIAAGDTIASLVHSRFSGTMSPIKPWGTFCVATVWLLLPSVASR
jgi:hypothetical protein